MTILYIGNFDTPYSTENDRAWSFNQLGHSVLAVQENRATVKDLDALITNKKQKVDLVIYSHTHGWEIEGLKDFFVRCKDNGIPTASVHLDRWAWLQRASDIGTEATWKTEYQFMADGSPEAVELYEAHKLNWHFLKPGVIARDCYMAKPDTNRFPHEVVFIGSKGYHPEYPFREKLIKFLSHNYGPRFGHYGDSELGSVRGPDLNVLLASAKVVVGDSCFGGRPRYVSDRYYETRGRGGMLIHPHVEGIDTEGVHPYDALNTSSLGYEIDFMLGHNKDREHMRRKGFEHVKNHETYTHRAHEMLTVIFGEQPPIPEEKDAMRQD